MLYKIVKTYENNKDRLFIVPSFWEDKNILKWPRKNEAKHLKNASTPEADWKQLNCIVKRNNIPSYETAEYVLKEMLNHTDTEDDTNTFQKPTTEKPLRQLNLNILADEIVYPAATGSMEIPHAFESCKNINVEKTKNIILEIPDASGSNVIASEIPGAYHIFQDNQSTNNQHQYYNDVGQNFETFNVILSNQTEILNELKSVKNIQNQLIQKVALFSVQLDNAVSQISQENFQVTCLEETRFTPSNTAFCIEPVDDIQQLNELEQQLSNHNTKQKLKQTYSVLFSGGKGIDCAYGLADRLFTRKFLCQCTWSGGSRGDDTKIAFKSFKNVLSFFWEMIHSWDDKYTIDDNEKFFKNILKNSKKRKMAKNQRASTSRKRIKLSNAENVNDLETSDEDTSDESNVENKKEEEDQEPKEKSEIDKETQYIKNNQEEKGAEKEDIDKLSEKGKINMNKVKTDNNIENQVDSNKNCVIEINKSIGPNENNKEENYIKDSTEDLKENNGEAAKSQEIEREQNDDEKIIIDTIEATLKEPIIKDKSEEPKTFLENNRENMLREPIIKDKREEPRTYTNSHFEKHIVKISKKMGKKSSEKKRASFT